MHWRDLSGVNHIIASQITFHGGVTFQRTKDSEARQA